MTDEERDARAAEYVLGSMPADERTEFERAMIGEPALQATVRAWEERLIGLADLIPAVAPPATLWERVERSTGTGTRPAFADPVRSLRRSRARWRGFAGVATAIAAGLVLFVGTGKLGERSASYLAVVNRGGDLPALVVSVDTRAGLVTVRSVSAETPASRSLELWYIAAAGGAPRSLGLVDQPRRQAVLPAIARSGDLAGGTLAVSVEPSGGSPTGAPTGPVIYSGKLIQE